MEPDDEEVYEEGNVLTTTLNEAEISIASEFNYDAQKYGTVVAKFDYKLNYRSYM